MKRFYSKFRIGLLTFTLGSASVFLTNNSLESSDEIPVDLPQVESSSVFEIITKENWKGFEFVGQGCGGKNKYGDESSDTGYRTSDWKHVSVSYSGYETSEEAKKEISSRISEASNILELKKNKIILEKQESENKWVDVIKYDGKKSLEITTSSSLELILQFDKWKRQEE